MSNLVFVLHDTADLLQALRAEGRTVLLHGVRGMSRVPAAACAFRRYRLPPTPALADIERVLLGARVNDTFRDTLAALSPVVGPPPMQRPSGGRVGRSVARWGR
jgi:ADP-ribosyl-[dinitrogen reductase] hydrolase